MTALRGLKSLLTVAGLCLCLSAALSAHMKVEKTEPAADAVVSAPAPHVQVFFSDAPDLAMSKVEIKGPSPKTTLTALHTMGNSLMAMVQGDMPDGAYTVSWQTAGPDGHVQKGDFTFTVKKK